MVTRELRPHGGCAACVYIYQKKKSKEAISVNTRPKVVNTPKNSLKAGSVLAFGQLVSPYRRLDAWTCTVDAPRQNPTMPASPSKHKFRCAKCQTANPARQKSRSLPSLPPSRRDRSAHATRSRDRTDRTYVRASIAPQQHASPPHKPQRHAVQRPPPPPT